MVFAASSGLSGKTSTEHKQQQVLMIGYILINTADTDDLRQRVKTTLMPLSMNCVHASVLLQLQRNKMYVFAVMQNY